MKIENFCCVAAELQNKMTGTTKMSQIYYYRAYEEETLEEMLTTGFFNAIQDRVKKDDMILLYEPNTNDTPQMTWVKVVSNIGGVVTISEVNPPAPAQEQADWTEADSTAVSYIKNKPSEGVGISFANNTISIDADSSPIEDSTKPITSGAVYTALSNKQDTLVSGTNIKTINNNSILGSGDLQIDSLPSQTGHAGEYLTTDGTDASWAAISSTYHPTLFSWEWSDCLKNDVQWLRADTFSWQDGSVYEAAYQHLVDDITGKTAQTETVAGITVTFYLADDGHKIVDVANVSAVESLYTATGVAWYYVIDTVNEKFKLPRTKFGVVGLRGNVGDFVEAGLPNITGEFRLSQNTGGFESTNQTLSGVFYSNKTYSSSYHSASGSSGNVAFDASRSSSIYGNSTTVQPPATEMYLYFYVGSFTQTALENTAGITAETLNSKMDKGAIQLVNSPVLQQDNILYLVPES